ncbi:cobalamin biosynthesis protein CobQ, partial [filamentous cyanobacterium CCP4]
MVSPFLKRYGSALNRYKWPCLTSFLAVVGLSTAVALQPPPLPQYRAEGVLVTTNSAPADDEESTQSQAPSVVSENALLSERLLQTVAQDLATIPIAITPQTLRDHTQVTLENSAEQGQQISVAFTWPDVDQAQVILDRMFEAIVDLSLEANQAKLQTIIEALERQLPAVESTLLAAEEDLKNYDRAQGLALQAAQEGNLLTAIANGQEQQRQNDIALAAIQSQMQSLQ